MPDRTPKNGEYWWVSIDDTEPTIAQKHSITSAIWYTCGSEWGWPGNRVVPLRRVPTYRQPATVRTE
jgi:hypothetical protein